MKTVFIFLVLFFIFTQETYASSQLRVLEVKGNRAIVSFDGEPPKVGERLSATTSETAGPYVEARDNRYLKLKNPRDYALGVDFAYSSLSTATRVSGVSSPSTKTTLMTMSGLLMFNFSVFELGPVVSVDFSQTGSAKPISTSALGVRGDLNFIKNQPGVVFVPGVGFLGNIVLTSSDGVSGSGLGGDAELFLKIFPFINPVSFKIGLDYTFSKTTLVNTETEISGIQFTVGLQVYL